MDLDTSQLPKRIMTTLMLRGSQTPPLRWSAYPNRTAKNVLDEAVANTELFDVEALADGQMASAVRALLYLWNGWLDEARKIAVNAPELERAFIQGVIERQAGDISESKACFQGVEAHPVFDELATYAPKIIGDTKTAILKRMREVIAFVEQWEPYLFADVYKLAAEGKLDENDELMVRNIQNQEFELLFKHCFEAAAGRTLKTRPADTAPVHAKTAKRPSQTKTYKNPPPSNAPPANLKNLVNKPFKKQITGVFVACPHCQEQNRLSEEQRGTVASCCKCRAAFKVPKRTGLAAGPK